MRHGLQRFLNAEEGATIVEFAVVGGLLFMLLFIVIEFALIWLTTAMLENAMVTSARYAKTNFSYSGAEAPDAAKCQYMNRDDTVRCLVTKLGGGIVNPAEIAFKTRILGKNWGSADMNSATEGLGDTRDIVIYEARYEKEIHNPLIRPFFTNGKYVIRASTLTQNEQ